MPRKRPSPFARDSKPEVDAGKVVLGLGLLGVAAWLTYTFVIKPGQQPKTPTTPIQPGPGPGNLPAPGEPVGNSAAQGDTIIVATKNLSGLPDGVGQTVEMTVTGAVAGAPVIIAQATGRAGDGLPQGFGLPVPRKEIVQVEKPGGGPAPAPGNLPGPIPGLPNVVPPAPSGPVDLGNPMNVTNGHHYRARLQLDDSQAKAVGFLGTGPISSQLSAVGFSDVQVFAATDPLPADWPPSTIVTPSPNVFYAMGTWQGPTGPAARPPQIAMAWEQ